MAIAATIIAAFSTANTDETMQGGIIAAPTAAGIIGDLRHVEIIVGPTIAEITAALTIAATIDDVTPCTATSGAM